MNVEKNKIVNYNKNTQNTNPETTQNIDKNHKLTYTVQEIAELLDISTKSAYKLVNSGQFSCKRIGRILRISRTSFNQWLDAGESISRKELI